MDCFRLKNLTFSYPEQEQKALDNINLNIKAGSFTVICGPSGCGKSTLLRHFKPVLSPAGSLSGEILYKGAPLKDADMRTLTKEIGFILQNPENQIVTDKVWHELAFGLESLGEDTDTIRRKVAETASFFGIENWFYKNVNELSGGQKQLLCLGSIMAMQPSCIISDEPTSQLDPIAASEFLSVLGKINRELGITVIITEHRLEEVFPYATDVVVMEKGRITAEGSVRQVGEELKKQNNGMFLAFPAPMRIWAKTDSDLPCPVNVSEGKDFLKALSEKKTFKELDEEKIPETCDKTVLSCENVWFRYEKDAPDILKGFDFSLKKGEFYALLGGNGTGKTTALKVLSGLMKPQRGSVSCSGKTALLPQNPQTLFIKKTVRENLYDIIEDITKDKKIQDEKVIYWASICEIENLMDRHPYDLSGGEQQRTALAMVMLRDPDILLLDEPTKGFDAEFKIKFASVLYKLLGKGISILTVSHDIVFCSEFAFKCGLFFDGRIISENTPRKFFSGNSFYTTPANLTARNIIPDAVTVNDVIYCTGGTPDTVPVPEPIITEEEKIKITHEGKPSPLPIWKKICAGLCGIVSLAVLIYALTVTDLSEIINSGGFGGDIKNQLPLYIILIISLTGLIILTGKKQKKKPYIKQKKQKTTRRTAFGAVISVIFIPLTLFASVYYIPAKYYNIVSLIILFECMLPFFIVFEGRKPNARELTVIAVLCALGIAGRAAFFMLPQFKPVMAITIIAGAALGGETGFLVGALTMLTSNIMFSQGPWTPWQMFAMGITGFIAGILFRKGLLAPSKISMSVFGLISAIVIYGGIMNPASAIMFSPESINMKLILTYYISGLPMDIIHAASTFIFLMLAGEPMLTKLERIKVKYGLL